MRVVFIAATFLVLGGSAFAQNSLPKYGEVDKDKSPSDIAAERAAEKAYHRSLGNIPNKGPGDPWGAVRSPDAGKTTATRSKAKSTMAPN